MGQRQLHSPEFKRELVARATAEGDIPSVARDGGVAVRKLRKWVKLAQTRPDLISQKAGRTTILPPDAEQHLHEWILGRQVSCHPVGREDIMRKARTIGELVCDTSLGPGWYMRFMERHAKLSVRTAQPLSKSRGSVINIDIDELYKTLTEEITDCYMDGSRVFNMDETAFQTKSNSKKVVVLRGSKAVWTLDPTTNFHLTIVACASASGFVVPPVYILPGKTVKVDVLNGCDIEGAAVTTSPTGFINMALFSAWLRFFSNSVPATTKRPLLLILDGCASHYSQEVLDVAQALQIKMVLLPPNATHLLQPLDVAVFSTLKGKLRRLLSELMEEQGDGSYTIDKASAIKLVSLAWMQSHLGKNSAAGFKTCGLYPVSLEKMTNRLNRFKRNGTGDHPLQASWLQVKEHVEASVLTIPPTKPPSNKRKRASVGRKLLTQELLEAAAAKPLAKPKKKSKKEAAPVPVVPPQVAGDGYTFMC